MGRSLLTDQQTHMQRFLRPYGNPTEIDVPERKAISAVISAKAPAPAAIFAAQAGSMKMPRYPVCRGG
jgi:hypothetical protein